VKPSYLATGSGHSVAAIYQPATAAATGTAVLLVPPFGWDDQTSYRARRDWSLALAASGFASLRIDLPGTGDSSGTARDDGLVDAWTAAVAAGVDWLRAAGTSRIAVIALGAGGLLTLQAMARGTAVDDLVLWGMPLSGRALIREIKAFGRLEQFQTGEPAGDMANDELSAGGHMLGPQTLAALSSLDSIALLAAAAPARAFVLGRDGIGPEDALLTALRSVGAEVRSDPGHGWGDVLATPQPTSPTAIFDAVNAWLGEVAAAGAPLPEPQLAGEFELGAPGERFRETPVVFEHGGQRLYAVVAEPVDAPVADGTIVLFNAGALRRIGPNRMWTEAARRWAAAGIPVIRVDLEGIGDAGGDGTKYVNHDTFYTEDLVEQARGALDLADERQLPGRFLLGGLCSGAWWSFELSLDDPRISGVVMLNPRLLVLDAAADGNRELRKLRRLLTRSGLRNMLQEKRKLKRAWRFASFLLRMPRRMLRHAASAPQDELFEKLQTLNGRGQRIDIAFSGDEPLHHELAKRHGISELEKMGVNFHELPYKSHTLKPLKAQKAAHAMLDEIVLQSFPGLELNLTATTEHSKVHQGGRWDHP
jgi:pimeloyl-ACP methyl ester carboxylesterase